MTRCTTHYAVERTFFWSKRAFFASIWSFSQTGWFYMDYNSAG